ncbi:hypothetical protein, partial [Nitrosomonas nitrosa]|uniref:hypothetical protein n=1 Tax=Nitrosomonas nitrosa TaxID=52442 RepID=UPI0023F8A109
LRLRQADASFFSALPNRQIYPNTGDFHNLPPTYSLIAKIFSLVHCNAIEWEKSIPSSYAG